MLSGYKTYIAAVVGVVAAVGAYLTGDADLAQTLQIVLTSILGATLRNGMTAR